MLILVCVFIYFREGQSDVDNDTSEDEGKNVNGFVNKVTTDIFLRLGAEVRGNTTTRIHFVFAFFLKLVNPAEI